MNLYPHQSSRYQPPSAHWLAQLNVLLTDDFRADPTDDSIWRPFFWLGLLIQLVMISANIVVTCGVLFVLFEHPFMKRDRTKNEGAIFYFTVKTSIFCQERAARLSQLAQRITRDPL